MLMMLILMLSAFMLTGCGSDTAKKQGGGSTTQSEKADAGSQKAKTDQKKEKDKDKKKKSSANSTGSESGKESASSGSADSGSGSSAGSGSGGSKSAGSSGSSAAKKRKKNRKTCTISVEASKIRHSSADAAVKKLVPASGVLLSRRTVTVGSGDTVKSVLFRAARSAGISVVGSTTVYGYYVQGIGDIYETDGGGTSGWIYLVNGKFATKSCNKYKVKAGDKIEWHYTIEPNDYK